MIALAIDASTYRGTVAVLRDATVAARTEAVMRGADADALMPAVAQALADAGVEPRDLDRVICGAGPGSFTSLRMAGGIAKGLALGLGIPLFAVPSLALVAAAAAAPGKYLATLDALRDEWFGAVYERSPTGTVTEQQPSALIPKSIVATHAASIGATVIGAAAGNCEPHAAGSAILLDTIAQSGPVDLDGWEPAYGRLAEAQVKWEAAHGRALSA